MGSGVFEEGEMLLSCGTSWVEFFPVKSRKFAISTKGLVDRFMLDGSPYCVMKSITSISEKIDALRLHYLGEISHKEYDTRRFYFIKIIFELCHIFFRRCVYISESH